MATTINPLETETRKLIERFNAVFTEAERELKQAGQEYQLGGLSLPTGTVQLLSDRYGKKVSDWNDVIAAQIAADGGIAHERVAAARKADAEGPERDRFFLAVPAYAVMTAQWAPEDFMRQIDQATADGRRVDGLALCAVARQRWDVLPGRLAVVVLDAETTAKAPELLEAEATAERFDYAQKFWAGLAAHMARRIDDVVNGRVAAAAVQLNADFVFGHSRKMFE